MEHWRLWSWGAEVCVCVCGGVSYAVSVCVCVCDVLGHCFQDAAVVEKMSWKTERGGFGCCAQGQELVAGPRLRQPRPALKSSPVLVLRELWWWNSVYLAHICVAV